MKKSYYMFNNGITEWLKGDTCKGYQIGLLFHSCLIRRFATIRLLCQQAISRLYKMKRILNNEPPRGKNHRTFQSERYYTPVHNKIISILICIFWAATVFLSLCSCNVKPYDNASTESYAVFDTELNNHISDDLDWMNSSNEDIVLNWYINFSWFTSVWGGNLVSDTITNETGIHVDFVTPGGNEREKLDAMLESGLLPDMITLGHWEPEVARLIDEGLVYPLNDLADEYSPFFWETADPDRVAWYTSPDGNLYAYPNSSYTPKDYIEHKNIGSNMAFLVRKDIYEAIGSPDMTTPDGFQKAIRDASESFSETDGKPLIPVGLYEFDKDGCFSLEEILMNFLAVPFEKNGKKFDRFTHPDYIAWLKTFRKLTADGYIRNEVFMDKRAQMAEKVADGRYFCMIYQHTDIADQQKLLYEKNPNMAYIAVDGPRNEKKEDPTLPGVGITGWTVTLISKNCKYPDRAIQFLTYLMSEHGQMLTFLGVEGQTYDMKNDRPVIRPDVFDLLNRDRVQYNQLYGADNTYWMLQDLVMQLDWQIPVEAPLDQPKEWTYPYTKYMSQYDANFGTNSHASNANKLIREEWGRILPALLLCQSDEEFDEVFHEYLKKREALGYDIVMKEATIQMNVAKEKLSYID